jgi:hypothetical protein
MYLEEELLKLKNDVSSLTEKVTRLDAALISKCNETYCSTKETAVRLRMSRAAVLDQIRKGKIAAVKTSPTSERSRYKVPETEINRILNL